MRVTGELPNALLGLWIKRFVLAEFLVENMIGELIIEVMGEAEFFFIFYFLFNKKKTKKQSNPHTSRFAYPKCKYDIYLQEIKLMRLNKTERLPFIHGAKRSRRRLTQQETNKGAMAT